MQRLEHIGFAIRSRLQAAAQQRSEKPLLRMENGGLRLSGARP
jgi:hypothetical protein